MRKTALLAACAALIAMPALAEDEPTYPQAHSFEVKVADYALTVGVLQGAETENHVYTVTNKAQPGVAASSDSFNDALANYGLWVVGSGVARDTTLDTFINYDTIGSKIATVKQEGQGLSANRVMTLTGTGDLEFVLPRWVENPYNDEDRADGPDYGYEVGSAVNFGFVPGDSPKRKLVVTTEPVLTEDKDEGH